MSFVQVECRSRPNLERFLGRIVEKYNELTGFDIEFSILYEEDDKTIVQLYGNPLKYERSDLFVTDYGNFISRNRSVMYGTSDVSVNLHKCAEEYVPVCPSCDMATNLNMILVRGDGEIVVVGYDCGCGNILSNAWSNLERSITMGRNYMNSRYRVMKEPFDLVKPPLLLPKAVSKIMYYVDTVKTFNMHLTKNLEHFEAPDSVHHRYSELVDEIRNRSVSNVAAYNFIRLVEGKTILVNGWTDDTLRKLYNYVGMIYYDKFVEPGEQTNEWFGDIEKRYERDVIVVNYTLSTGTYGDFYLAIFKDVETGCNLISFVSTRASFAKRMRMIDNIVGKKIRIGFTVKEHTYDRLGPGMKITKIARPTLVKG